MTRRHVCLLQPVFPPAKLPVLPLPAQQRSGLAPLRPPRLHWWGLVGDLLRWWVVAASCVGLLRRGGRELSIPEGDGLRSGLSGSINDFTKLGPSSSTPAGSEEPVGL